MNGGDLVYLARRKAGLTQIELGERAGLAQNAIARIESCKVKTSFETIRDLVRACGFEPEVSFATGDTSYRRDIKRRLAASPAERVLQSTDLAHASQRMRRRALASRGR
jgi:transcriptional regulator with XRE-family HTH domain